ncbi:MAG: Flp pilus assembly complex ATPase component TadA, partial [Burkholderiaceae bacterium]|nr:Flp pilus assembly complex ATPase component TadA [Burkholderiaceae bacterium]
MAMDRLFSLMAEKKASDVYLAPGSAVHIRINGVSIPVNQQPLDSAGVEALLREVLTDRQWQDFLERRELNVGYGIRGVGSYRINVFQQRGTPAAVVRYIPGDIPTLDSLNLPPLLAELVMERRGLVLVVGATGSGKSTTLASMIDHRNGQRSGHILTFEDPIEFVFRNKRSIVNQRQIGSDTDSLAIGLKNAMRQAPDCILIGEIR